VCFRSYLSSSSLSIVFFCFAVRFFGGSCVYLECELVVNISLISVHCQIQSQDEIKLVMA
jgi:hypothetical protein